MELPKLSIVAASCGCTRCNGSWTRRAWMWLCADQRWLKSRDDGRGFGCGGWDEQAV